MERDSKILAKSFCGLLFVLLLVIVASVIFFFTATSHQKNPEVKVGQTWQRYTDSKEDPFFDPNKVMRLHVTDTKGGWIQYCWIFPPQKDCSPGSPLHSKEIKDLRTLDWTLVEDSKGETK